METIPTNVDKYDEQRNKFTNNVYNNVYQSLRYIILQQVQPTPLHPTTATTTPPTPAYTAVNTITTAAASLFHVFIIDNNWLTPVHPCVWANPISCAHLDNIFHLIKLPDLNGRLPREAQNLTNRLSPALTGLVIMSMVKLKNTQKVLKMFLKNENIRNVFLNDL